MAVDPLDPESGIESVIVPGSNDVKVNVYPNPATSYVTVDTDASEFRATLYTLDGRPVESRTMRSHDTMDVSNLPGGLYLLDVVTGTGHHCTRLTIK